GALPMKIRIRPILRALRASVFLAFGALPVAVSAQLVNVSPVFADFGPIKLGAVGSVPVRIQNPNAISVTVTGGNIATTQGFGNGAGACNAPVPPGGSCTLVYTFQPRLIGNSVEASAVILVSGASGTQSVPLRFRGKGDETLIQASPRTIDFGEE